MREFFGLNLNENGEYTYLRGAEGAWSWQHLTFVSLILIAMVALAIFFGMRNKHKDEKQKNTVLIWCAFLIDSFEIVKIIVLSIRAQDPLKFLYVLPLFLCSIQLIAIPMAAFCKGRIKEACLDFVLTFGILGAVFGTIGATQNYGCYPVLSMDNVFSGITHSISGFASLYIGISGMISLKKKNLPICLGILGGFSVLAYVANVILDYNYMFLMYHDDTPYSIFYNMVGGSPVFYPLIVVGVFVIYLVGFYHVYGAIKKKKQENISVAKESEATEATKKDLASVV